MKGQELVKRVLSSKLVRWGFIALALGLGGYAIAKQWTDIDHGLHRIGRRAAGEALLALLVMQFATLRTWTVLLAGLGTKLPTTAAGRVLFIGQLGKYVPGSVWPVLAQMELGATYRVPRTRSAAASVLTMLLSLLTGLLVAAATLPFAAHHTDYKWGFFLVPVLLACLHPRVLNPLLTFLFKLAKRPPLEHKLTGGVLVRALGWSLLAWIFNGLQIWLLVDKFGAPLSRGIMLSLGGYAFAWCMGFVVILAPAGGGIREVLLVATLGPIIGTPGATAVALVSRVVTTASDVIVAGAAAFRRPKTAGKHAGGVTAADAAPVPAAPDPFPPISPEQAPVEVSQPWPHG